MAQKRGQKNMDSFRMCCFRRMEKIKWSEKVNNEEDAFNPPSVATDLRGTHDTSLGALPPLYSVESAHL